MSNSNLFSNLTSAEAAPLVYADQSVKGIECENTVEIRVTKTSVERDAVLRAKRNKPDDQVKFTLSHGRIIEMATDGRIFGAIRTSRSGTDGVRTPIWCKRVAVPALLGTSHGEMSPMLAKFLQTPQAQGALQPEYSDFDLGKFLTLTLGHDNGVITFNIGEEYRNLMDNLEQLDGHSLVLRFNLADLNVSKEATLEYRGEDMEIPLRVTPTYIGVLNSVTSIPLPGSRLDPETLNWAMEKASEIVAKSDYLSPAKAERQMLSIAGVGTGKKAHLELKAQLFAAEPYSREWELAKNRLYMVAHRGTNHLVTEESVAAWVEKSLDQPDTAAVAKPKAKPATVAKPKAKPAVKPEPEVEDDEPKAHPVSDEVLDSLFD